MTDANLGWQHTTKSLNIAGKFLEEAIYICLMFDRYQKDYFIRELGFSKLNQCLLDP